MTVAGARPAAPAPGPARPRCPAACGCRPGRPRRSCRTARPRRPPADRGCGTTVSVTRGAPATQQRLGLRCGAELGRLAGQLRGQRRHPPGDAAQRAAEPRQRREGGRVAAGRVQDRLRIALQRRLRERDRRGARDARVGVGEHGATGGGARPGTDPALHGVAERGRLEPAAPCLRGAGRTSRRSVAGGGVGRAAVVAARVPDHRHRRAVRGDLPGVGVGLVQPEQRVRLTLDQQGRCGDPVGDRRGEERRSSSVSAGEGRPVVAASV